jgi:hypothetical protein
MAYGTHQANTQERLLGQMRGLVWEDFSAVRKANVLLPGDKSLSALNSTLPRMPYQKLKSDLFTNGQRWK